MFWYVCIPKFAELIQFEEHILHKGWRKIHQNLCLSNDHKPGRKKKERKDALFYTKKNLCWWLDVSTVPFRFSKTEILHG